MVGSASKRADGCAQRGKTRGKIVWDPLVVWAI
jgi:hypothetical protein